MKRVISMLTLLLGLALVVNAQDSQKPADVKDNGAVMTFETTEIDYGTIQQGADPHRVFVFKNTGTAPLIITNAKGSCGCTVPTYPKNPIPPGETGEIKVRYDTNRVGQFTKRVTLTTNAGEQPIELTIKGNVESKPEAPESVPAGSGSMFNKGGK